MARIYLRPQLGALPLTDLTVPGLNQLFVQLLGSGGRRGGPLSRRTVKYAHAVLRKALDDAVQEGVLTDNVARRATVPRIDPDRDPLDPVPQTWDAQQAQRFLALTSDQPLHDLWRVALGTGMRRGELLGLRWQDVDLDVPQLRVSTSLAFIDGKPYLKGTKTGHSRVLHLDRHRTPTPPRRWPAAGHRRADGYPLVAQIMDIYAHVLPAISQDAAAAIGRALTDGA